MSDQYQHFSWFNKKSYLHSREVKTRKNNIKKVAHQLRLSSDEKLKNRLKTQFNRNSLISSSSKQIKDKPPGRDIKLKKDNKKQMEI